MPKLLKIWIWLHLLGKCSNAWSCAGILMEMRQYFRENGITRDGPWLVGRMDE